MKMIQVEPKTHENAKTQAKARGMLLRSYIDMLVEQDKKKLNKKG